MKNRNAAVDLFKYIASLLIIGIHTGVFSDVSRPLYVFVVQILCRMGVPFFAVCTGYFMGRKQQSGGDPGDGMKRQWVRILVLYGVWSLIYLVFSIPGWIRIGWFSAWAFVDYGIAAVRSDSHYHLWYLNSLIYALPLFYLCIRYGKRTFWLLSSVLLYGVKVLMYGYRTWMPEGIRSVFGIMDKASGLTNGVFCLLPFLLLGACIAGEKGSPDKKRLLAGTAGALLLLTLEVVLLYRAGQENVSFVVFTYPLAYFAFRLVLSLRVRIRGDVCRTLGEASLFIYCVHPMFIETVGERLENTVARYLLVACLSTAAGLLWSLIKNKGKRRKTAA